MPHLHHSRSALLLAILTLLITRPLAIAGPPFQTDDPEPVDLHHGELYIASHYVLSIDGSAATAPEVEFNYGPLENLQLHLVAPLALDKPDGARTEYGYGDTELGFKYRFIQESDYLPMVAIFPLVELPTGSASHNLGNGRVQVYIPLWFQKSFGKWTTYGGGGYWFNNADGAKDHWFVGWEIQYQINDHLTLGAEIFHTTSAADGDTDHTAFNLGAIIDLTDNHHLLFSAGRDIQGNTLFTSYLAYQFTF